MSTRRFTSRRQKIYVPKFFGNKLEVVDNNLRFICFLQGSISIYSNNTANVLIPISIFNFSNQQLFMCISFPHVVRYRTLFTSFLSAKNERNKSRKNDPGSGILKRIDILSQNNAWRLETCRTGTDAIQCHILYPKCRRIRQKKLTKISNRYTRCVSYGVTHHM